MLATSASRGRDGRACGRGVLDVDELPIADYDELHVSGAVATVKDLTSTSDVRAIIAYEEANKNRQRVVSAAQTHVAAIAQEVVGINWFEQPSAISLRLRGQPPFTMTKR